MGYVDPGTPTSGTVIATSWGTNVRNDLQHLNDSRRPRNLLINGGFEIWQDGAGPFTLSGAYCADGWKILTGNGSTVSISRDYLNNDGASGFNLAFTYTHAASGYASISQYVEGYEEFRSRPATFIVRVKAATAGAVMAFMGDGVGISYSSPHSGSGVYETLVVTRTMDTNATMARFGITANAPVSGAFYVDNAMAVFGSEQVAYEPVPRAEDWARVLRYYEVLGPRANGGDLYGFAYSGTASGAGSAHDMSILLHYYRKRNNPIVTKQGTWSATNVDTTGGSGGFYIVGVYPNSCRMYWFPLAAGHVSWLSNSTDDGLTIDSRL